VLARKRRSISGCGWGTCALHETTLMQQKYHTIFAGRSKYMTGENKHHALQS